MTSVSITRPRLVEFIEEHGMNQREFGEAVGCSPATICHYANGKRKPSIETMLRVSEAFSISLEEVANLLGYDFDRRVCGTCRHYVDTADKSMMYCWRTSRLKDAGGFCDEWERLWRNS